MTKLLDLSTTTLLEKIGAGQHKPGSGSAAALNGILACKLLSTVIQLTIDPKRIKNYGIHHSICNEINDQIKNEISPKLEHLFQEDSDQFDKAICKRNERNEASIQKEKNRLDEESLSALVHSTELPIQIAQLCVRLAEFSIQIFDIGFKSARGDSGVALSSSLSAISGCLSIINLNLTSFAKNDWTENIKASRNEIRKKFELFTSLNNERLDILEEEADLKNNFLGEINTIKKTLLGKSNIKYSEIDALAKSIQNTLWENKNLVWKNETPERLIDILDSKKVIKLLKYAVYEEETLGVTDENVEIAAIINNEKEEIRVSKVFPSEVQNFTIAHELGHALMHNELILHRDKPLNQPETHAQRPLVEKQADKFASYFLMPEKLLIQIFSQLFHTRKLTINQNTSKEIANCTLDQFKSKVKDLRAFTRLVAGASFYQLTPFRPLHEIFNVSIEAMAIRLEELKLVEY